MASFIKTLLRKWKYGEEVIVVSGLPRSGTSMMMKMLTAGGLTPMTDEIRTADIDNPKGYYEFERVKNLAEEKDKSWVRESRGKVLKVISFLLKDLPADNFYRVIFMARDIDEVLASQNKMLEHRGEENDIEDARMRDLYLDHLRRMRYMVKHAPNFEMLEIPYAEAVADPAATADRVNAFLDHRLTRSQMTEVVDESLYRNRKQSLRSPG